MEKRPGSAAAACWHTRPARRQLTSRLCDEGTSSSIFLEVKMSVPSPVSREAGRGSPDQEQAGARLPARLWRRSGTSRGRACRSWRWRRQSPARQQPVRGSCLSRTVEAGERQRAEPGRLQNNSGACRWCRRPGRSTHLAGAALDHHEPALADSTGRLRVGVGGAGIRSLELGLRRSQHGLLRFQWVGGTCSSSLSS